MLAHELGHFKLQARREAHRVVGGRCRSRSSRCSPGSMQEPGSTRGSAFRRRCVPTAIARPGVALALFLLALPVFTFVLSPLASLYSRRHEFEADAFAAQHASGRRARAGAGQAVRGQRVDADARPAALGVLRFASARGGPRRAARRRSALPRPLRDERADRRCCLRAGRRAGAGARAAGAARAGRRRTPARRCTTRIASPATSQRFGGDGTPMYTRTDRKVTHAGEAAGAGRASATPSSAPATSPTRRSTSPRISTCATTSSSE